MAFISAVLGGFVFAFLGTLLTVETEKRVWTWTVGATALASVCFIVSAVGATFSAAVVVASPDPLPVERIAELQQRISVWFFPGILMLFTSLGLSGWTRSRTVGTITTCVAIVGAIGVAFMMVPFIS